MKKKFYFISLILFILILTENKSFAESLNLYSKYRYEINTPKEIKLNIKGKDYIKYLKQIKI